MKRLLWFLRIPESILAFIGGVFLSYSINIYTNTEATLVQNIVATLFLVASLLLVIWVLLLQKLDVEYKKVSSDKKDLAAWRDVLASKSNKKYKIGLFITAIGMLVCFVVGVALLIVFKFV